MLSKMDALVLSKEGGQPVLRLERRPIPTPGADEALVKVKASKINPSDVLNVNGGFPYTTYPRIPGRDYAGIVVSCDASPHFVGKNVFGTSGRTLGFTKDGAHAEYVVVPAESLVLMPATPGFGFELAASIGVPYTTALDMIERAHLDMSTSDNRILIIGGRGNVGKAIAVLLQAQGLQSDVFVANRNDGYIELHSFERMDVIFSCVPDTAVLQQVIDQNILADGGKLVFIATSRPATEKLQIDPMKFYRQDWSLIGVNSVNFSMQRASRMMENIRNLLQMDGVRVSSRVTRHASLKDGASIYRDFANTSDDMIFIM